MSQQRINKKRRDEIAELRKEMPRILEANVSSVTPLEIEIGGGAAVPAKGLPWWTPTIGDRVSVLTQGHALPIILQPLTTTPAAPSYENISDGDPPASSPDAIMVGGIRWIAFGWSAITNNDPVTYEVHLSTSSGFTPDSTTLVGEVAGTIFYAYQLQDGTPLAYDTTYYGKIMAKDEDGGGHADPTPVAGAEDSAELVPVNSPDIVAEAIQGTHIAGQEITADKFAATLALISKIQTAEAGQRVEIDPQGIRLVGSDDEDLVVLPTDEGQSASFRGDAEFNTAEFLGPATFRDPGNEVAVGGEINLAGAQGNPPSAPTLAITWDQLSLTGGVSGSGTGIAYAADGGSSADTPCFYTARAVGGTLHVEEWSASTGARIRELASLVGVDSALGGAQFNDGGTRRVYVLIRGGPSAGSSGRIVVYAQADGSVLASPIIASLLPALDAPATIGRGSSGPLLVTHAAAADGNLKIHTLDPTTGASTGSITTSGRSFPYSNMLITGIVQVGTDYWISTIESFVPRVRKFNSSGVYQANNDFYPAGYTSGYMGLTHDGSVFLSAETGANPKVYTHTDWTWTTESAKYWVAYSWTNGTSETQVSPRASVDMTNYRRAKLRITPATKPSGISANRIYAGRGATDPGATGSGGVQRQTTTTYIDSETNASALMKNFLAAGDDGPATNGFTASGSPAKVEPKGGTGLAYTTAWKLGGNNEFKLPIATNTTLATGPANQGDVVFNSTLGFVQVYDGTRWLPTDWTDLTLVNSWVAIAGYATPGWMIDSHGFVHIRGAVQNGSSATATIATLPAEARPATSKRFVVNSTAAAASFNITSGGVMNMNALGSTSSVILDGITPYEAGG